MIGDASTGNDHPSATETYKPAWTGAEAVLLVRWLGVAVELGLFAWLVSFVALGSEERGGSIAVGLAVGSSVLLTVAILAPRVSVVVEPSRLVVVNLFRTHVVDARSVTSIQEVRRRWRLSLWSVGAPTYSCVYDSPRGVAKRLQLTASVPNPKRHRLTHLLGDWCRANRVALRLDGEPDPSSAAGLGPAALPPGYQRPKGPATTSTQGPGTEKLMPFDSALATTANNVVFAVGLCSATAVVVLLAVTLLPGAPQLGAAAFVPSFLLAFPLFFWAVVVQRTLVRRERLEKGLPARPTLTESLGGGAFDQPEGFLRGGDKVVLAVAFAVGMVCIFTTRAVGNATPARPFLGGALVFTTAATVVALAEHRRRKRIHLGGVLGWPKPPTPPPMIGRSRAFIAWLLVTGLALIAVGGGTLVERVNAYENHEARLPSHGSTTVRLPGGDDVIFVGHLLESGPLPFGPAQVTVTEVRTGAPVHAFLDPSNDHNSPNEIPSLGLISFDAPAAGAYRITIDGPKGLTLFVARSPGNEARLVAAWVVMLVIGVGIAITGLVALLIRINWRYRVVRSQTKSPGTIEEWMAQNERR